MSESHIAGLDVLMEGDPGRLRQRCAWCHYVLLDYDLTNIANESAIPMWPVGAIIRVEDGMGILLVSQGESVELKERAPDACVFLDYDTTV